MGLVAPGMPLPTYGSSEFDLLTHLQFGWPRKSSSWIRDDLIVPFVCTSDLQRRAFSVAGPNTRNSNYPAFPSELRVLLTRHSVYSSTFCKHFNAVLYRRNRAGRASEWVSPWKGRYIRNTGTVNRVPTTGCIMQIII